MSGRGWCGGKLRWRNFRFTIRVPSRFGSTFHVRAQLGAISKDEVRTAFDVPLLDAPEWLQSCFGHAVCDLDGLDSALGCLSAGSIDEAVERMTMWLPNVLTAEEREYLDEWRAKVRSLIARSAEAIACDQRHAP